MGEFEIITYLKGVLPDVRVAGVIPAERPDVMVTVERVGGRVDGLRDCPLLAVQAWHVRAAEAAKLAHKVADLLVEAPAHVPSLASVTVDSVYNFPDPASGSPRYQLTVAAVFYPAT